MSDMSLGMKLQRMGAGFAGNLAQFDAARQQEEMTRLKRDEMNRALSKERLVAMAQDAQTAQKFLEMGEVDKTIQLLDERIGYINQFGGDPSDTQEFRDLVVSGDIDGALNELKLFTTQAEINGLIQPLAQPEARSNPGKLAQDEGLKPGTLAFAARVQELSAKPEAQPRIVEQSGIQYWANGPRAGQPVVPDAQGSQKSITDQFTERFGAIPANMTPEVVDGSITGRLVPMPGSQEDPAIKERNRTQALQEALPGAQKQMETIAANYDQTLQVIDQLIAEDNKGAVGDITGFGGSGMGDFFTLPGTDGARMRALADQLENRSFIQALQSMRDASPTGGAVGQVTEREAQRLINAEAALDRRQSYGDYVKALKTYRDTVEQARTNVMDAFNKEYGEMSSGGVINWTDL